MINKYAYTILLIFIGMNLMNDIQAATDTSEYKQPFYTIQISYVGTGSEFRLNDIPFYLETFSGQVDTEIPVSDKMIQGVNELKIIAFPVTEKDNNGIPDENWHTDARVEATLYVREKNSAKDTRQMLSHIKLNPGHPPESAAKETLIVTEQDSPTLDYESKPRHFPNTEYPKQIVISRTTHKINLPFSRWEWQDGMDINTSIENHNSLIEAYRKEYTIQKNQDINSLKESARKLAEIQKTVNYYDTLEQAYDVLNLEESWKSEEQELFDFIEGDKAKYFKQKIDIVGNGKLARITNAEGIQPIVYIIKEARIVVKYKFLFYMNKKGEWIYIM